jgi:uncharacterized protein involved in response to NO
MLFGFVGAVVSGFLLTAIPNWTGRLPIAGWPLAGLFTLWLAGRLAILFSGTIGLATAAIVDCGFYIFLSLICAREVLEAGNRNLPVVGLVMIFGLVNLLDYAAAGGFVPSPDIAWQAAVGLVIVMISVIGGRIVPSFTRNWLTKKGLKHGLPGQPTRFDLVVIALTALAFLAWISAPSGWLPGGILALAAACQLVRLSRWKGWKCMADPLVLVLHVGYFWVPVGLALLAAVELGAQLPRSVAVHALTAGAMATMILAVMTRASLGHTGRDLRAGPATTAIYLFVTLGAALRVGAPLGAADYRLGMEFAGTFWLAAFILFILVYGRILLAPRLGDKA